MFIFVLILRAHLYVHDFLINRPIETLIIILVIILVVHRIVEKIESKSWKWIWTNYFIFISISLNMEAYVDSKCSVNVKHGEIFVRVALNEIFRWQRLYFIIEIRTFLLFSNFYMNGIKNFFPLFLQINRFLWKVRYIYTYHFGDKFYL